MKRTSFALARRGKCIFPRGETGCKLCGSADDVPVPERDHPEDDDGRPALVRITIRWKQVAVIWIYYSIRQFAFDRVIGKADLGTYRAGNGIDGGIPCKDKHDVAV
jgi:hypothetical protein